MVNDQEYRDKYYQLLKQFNSYMERLDKRITNMEKQDVNYHITIEQLNIQDPILKELTFQLDKLNIKDVSGALNLGNNFGVRVEQGSKKQLPKQSVEKAKKQDDKKGSEQTAQKKDKSKNSTSIQGKTNKKNHGDQTKPGISIKINGKENTYEIHEVKGEK